jgi:fatty-acyl-CoA synthase
MGLLAEMRARGRKPEGLEMVAVGGSAASRSMIEAFERDFGVAVTHGWGMTELSPVGTLGGLEPDMETLPLDERLDLKARQGRRVFGVEMKIVDADGERQPHDGETVGELFVRGPFITKGYFENEAATARAFDAQGWFGTGDIAKITPDGFLMIVDRAKDLVKSGGEWISSIDIENMAMAHPGVGMCAVIGVAHPKWDERPLLVVVPRAGMNPTREELLAFLAERVAKWQVPDDVIFVEALAMTATGKISKLQLRKQLADYVLPDLRAATVA